MFFCFCFHFPTQINTSQPARRQRWVIFPRLYSETLLLITGIFSIVIGEDSSPAQTFKPAGRSACLMYVWKCLSWTSDSGHGQLLCAYYGMVIHVVLVTVPDGGGSLKCLFSLALSSRADLSKPGLKGETCHHTHTHTHFSNYLSGSYCWSS